MLGLPCVGLPALGGCGGSGDETSAASSQEVQAQDAQAQTTARTAQTALEVYATDHDGSYAGADAQELEAIERALRGASVDVSAGGGTYELAVQSESGTTFSLARKRSGAVRYECDPPGSGDCPPDGRWS
jgi:hypothetical protein